MHRYWYERIGIGAVMLLFYGSVLTFVDDLLQAWTILLVITTIVGFSHYLIGGYYQVKSLARTPVPVQRYRWYLLLSTLSVGAVIPFMLTGNLAWVAFATIGYFMLHGFFNEITLFERVSGGVGNRWSVGALAIGLAGLAIIGFAHPSAYFNPQLDYLGMNYLLLQALAWGSPFAEMSRWLGYGALAAAVCLQATALLRAHARRLQHALFLGVVVAATLGSIFIYPLNYVYVFTALLLYHFLIWFWFYLRANMDRAPGALRQYLLLHVLVFAPFAIAYITGYGWEWIDEYILNSYVFITLTTVHITTSFMSEPWFRRLAFKEAVDTRRLR